MAKRRKSLDYGRSFTRKSVEFWAHPEHDKGSRLFAPVIERIKDAYQDMRDDNPKNVLHILIERGDRYRALRSRLVKKRRKS